MLSLYIYIFSTKPESRTPRELDKNDFIWTFFFIVRAKLMYYVYESGAHSIWIENAWRRTVQQPLSIFKAYLPNYTLSARETEKIANNMSQYKS